MTRAYRVVVLLLLLALAGCGQKENGAPAVPMQIGSKAKAKAGGTSLTTAEKREERTPEQICQEFAALKNAGDPKANELLGRAPKVPDQPVAQEEFDALQTDFCLSCKCHVEAVRPVPGKVSCFTLKIPDTVVSPGIPLQGKGRFDRCVTGAVLTVEVRKGKIFGIRTDS